jgi:KUP system potassium uptake protein
MQASRMDISGVIKSMGLVFGDIGTSPIYTLTVVFLLIAPSLSNIIGVVSLVIWTLILLISVQYAWLAMNLGKKGEGGTIVLREILTPLLRSKKSATLVFFMSIIGISLFIGDGVITPAISILSAVEGILLIPGFGSTAQGMLIFIAAVIAILLFIFQAKGTERVAWTFGPIMVIWFFTLALSGILSLVQAPQVLVAFNPLEGIRFLLSSSVAGAFVVLASVILCATGGEALYADMGHLGREPIRKAWIIVFFALVLNYLGQGAFLLTHPGTRTVLFEMIFNQSSLLYVPFLLLSIVATVIASQAMISGLYSIVYQGITTRIFPIMKIDYTSAELRSQIYIDVVNWLLLLAVLFIMFEFKESTRLAAAYGLAVTGTMTVTGILIAWIFLHRQEYMKSVLAACIILVDVVFLISNLTKIPAGGYWSLVLAAIPLAVILIFVNGQKRIYQVLCPIPLKRFLITYNEIYQTMPKIKGTALFFARDIRHIPPYIGLTMFTNNIIYEDNIIISIHIKDNPFGMSGGFKKKLAEGLRLFEIQVGYMEVVDIMGLLKEAGIDEKTIFYGIEDIVTKSPIWRIFGIIKRLSATFVQFYKLPAEKLHGVVTRIEMDAEECTVYINQAS